MFGSGASDGSGHADVAANTAASHTQGSDTALGAQAENLDMNTHKIVGVVDPTTDQEGATKKYVDDNVGITADQALRNYLSSKKTFDYVIDFNVASVFFSGAQSFGSSIVESNDYIFIVFSGSDGGEYLTQIIMSGFDSIDDLVILIGSFFEIFV